MTEQQPNPSHKQRIKERLTTIKSRVRDIFVAATHDTPHQEPFVPYKVIETPLDPVVLKADPKVDISGLPQADRNQGLGRVFENFASEQSLSSNEYYEGISKALRPGMGIAPLSVVEEISGRPADELKELPALLPGVFVLLKDTHGGLHLGNLPYRDYLNSLPEPEKEVAD